MKDVTLVKYESARTALAVAKRVDEVKTIRDKAVAMQIYARQAKDTELIVHATEIKARAERRAGEMLREMAARGERERGRGGDRKSPSTRSDRDPKSPKSPKSPKLSDLGVTRDQSSQWQKIASIPEKAFDAALADAAAKSSVATTKSLASLASPNKNGKPEQPTTSGDTRVGEAARTRRRALATRCVEAGCDTVKKLDGDSAELRLVREELKAAAARVR
jgi:hypothetical protein